MSDVTMVANNESGWAFVETPESVNGRLQEQVTALAVEVAVVSAERDQLRAALEAVEWQGSEPEAGVGYCSNPACQQPQRKGHASDCIVGLAMKGRE